MTIIGHQKQWQFLKRTAEAKIFSHAYLFCGPEHLGKKTIAIEFLKLSFNQDPFHHPDFNYIEPIDKEIKISQIRDLNWKLSLKPFSAPFKAAVIDKAYLMNEEAQNCFLKMLEEPKGPTILILISEFKEALLPTIVSRCQAIKFYPVAKNDLENYLLKEKIKTEARQEIIRFSFGCPGRMLDFISCPEKMENLKKLFREFEKLRQSDLASRFQYAKAVSEKADLKETLEAWQFYLMPKLKEYLKFLRQLQNTIFFIQKTNVNQRLTLENLILEL